MSSVSAAAGAVRVSNDRTAPAEWQRLGDLLQVIAGQGDHTFLAMLTKQAEYHIALVLASQMLPPV